MNQAHNYEYSYLNCKGFTANCKGLTLLARRAFPTATPPIVMTSIFSHSSLILLNMIYFIYQCLYTYPDKTTK